MIFLKEGVKEKEESKMKRKYRHSKWMESLKDVHTMIEPLAETIHVDSSTVNLYAEPTVSLGSATRVSNVQEDILLESAKDGNMEIVI